MEQVPDEEEVSSTLGPTALGELSRDIRADTTEQRRQRKAIRVDRPPTT